MLITPRPSEYKGLVVATPDLIDGYGHVNNARYLDIYQAQRALYLQALGRSLEDLREEQDIRAVLSDGQVKYKRPVLPNEIVEVRTGAYAFRQLIVFNQDMYDQDEKLVSYFDCLAWAINKQGRPKRVPGRLVEVINQAKFL